MDNVAAALPHQEVIEAEGHLIDSHLMERIFDTVVEFQGRFEVEKFYVGRTNTDPSHLRMKVEAPSAEALQTMLTQLLGLAARRSTPATRDDNGGTRLLRARGFLLDDQPPDEGQGGRRVARRSKAADGCAGGG